MRTATRVVASAFGVAAGVAGIEHGIFEMLQGNARPEGLFIASMGPPCDPETTWNACEPALTILPNFFITGLLATLIGLLILIWSAAFVQRKNGGVILIVLSVVLLLFGGGIFPPLIGLVGGVAGTRINKPLTRSTTGAMHFLAALWPWPLVIFLVWVFGQFVVGYFFNELLQKYAYLSLLLIVALLPLSLLTGYAADIRLPAGSSQG